MSAGQQERRVGRPSVGPRINVHMPQDLIDRLDDLAAETDTTRSELIRRGAELALRHDPVLDRLDDA